MTGSRDSGFRSRAVRIPVLQVKAALGDINGQLVNISTSGALLRLDQAVPVGRRAALKLSKGSASLTLAVEVVRTTPVGDAHRAGDGCYAGVQFGVLSFESRVAIAKLLGD